MADAINLALSLCAKNWTKTVTGARIARLVYRKSFSMLDSELSECVKRKQLTRSQTCAPRAKAAAKPAASQQGTDRKKDMLDLVLDACDGEGWTRRDVLSECFIFFLAGHETSALALTWVFAHLGKNKAWQGELREEVSRVVPQGEVPSKEQLNGMPFLTACINESLRMYPPASIVARETDKEITVGGASVPKGYSVLINIMDIHLTPSAFPEPDTYDPDRWIKDPDLDKSKHFIPFSFGPRNCIGKDFFWIEAKTLLAAFVRSFEWETVGDIPGPTTLTGTLHPDAPAHIRIKPVA